MKTHCDNGKMLPNIRFKTGHEIKFVFICKYVKRYTFKMEYIKMLI